MAQASSLHRLIPHPQWPAWFWPAFWALAFGAAAVLTKESHFLYPLALVLVYVCFYRKSPLPKLSVGLLSGMLLALAALGWGIAGRLDGRIWAAAQLALAALIAGGLLGASPENGAAPPGRRRFFQQRIGAGWAFVIIVVGLCVTASLALPYAWTRLVAALTGYQGSSYVRSLASQAYAVPAMLLRAVAPISVTFSPEFNLTHSLNIDHEFPTISNPLDTRTLIGAAILLALGIVGILGAWRGWLASFGVLLALIAILPTNSVIERGDIVSERNFYLAAAGGACVLAWLAGGAARWIAEKVVASEATVWHDTPCRDGESLRGGSHNAKVESRHARAVDLETGVWTLIFAFCFAGPFVAFTTLRNNEWGDPYRLWKAAMERSPDKMRVLYNFGVSAKNSDESEAAFARAITIGEEMSKRGAFRPDEAVDVKCFHLAYWQLAKIHMQRYLRSNKEDVQSLNEIKQIYESGLNRTAWDPDLAMTYADFLTKLGRATEAVPMLQKSLALHSWADQLYLPLGVGSLEGSQFAAAADFLESALRLKDESALGYTREMSPDYLAQVYAYLGVARARLKSPEKAREACREALRLNPESVVPILFGYNSTRDFNLPEVKSSDELLNSLSQLRTEILIALRDGAGDLLASKNEPAPPNIARLKEVFDYELNRRNAIPKNDKSQMPNDK